VHELKEIDDLVAELQRRGARDEALGEWRENRLLFFRRPSSIEPVGRAWRLGALLLSDDGSLYEVARVTRAVEPRDFSSDKTVAGEQRREQQRAAARGRFERGETVNHGFRTVSVDQAQSIVGAEPLVAYLRDRALLLPSR
jgi:hypothetical protein